MHTGTIRWQATGLLVLGLTCLAGCDTGSRDEDSSSQTTGTTGTTGGAVTTPPPTPGPTPGPGAGAGTGQVATYSGDLVALVQQEILPNIPTVAGSGAGVQAGDQENRYVIPTGPQVADFRQAISLILSGQAGQAHTLIQSVASSYNVIEFTDTPTGTVHIILMEGVPGNLPAPIAPQPQGGTLPNAAAGPMRGWGTYIFAANPTRNLSVSAPHPKDDFRTGEQSVELYAGSGSHSLLIAGMDRDQNTAVAACDPSPNPNRPFREADMSHNDVTCFQAAFEEVYGANQSLWHVQLHGNSSCPDDVFISNGIETPPAIFNTLALNIRAESQAAAGGGATLTVDVFDNPGDYDLRGIKNTQMRYASGIANPAVCQQNNFPVSTSRMAHIELRMDARQAPGDPGATPGENRDVLRRAILATFP